MLRKMGEENSEEKELKDDQEPTPMTIPAPTPADVDRLEGPIEKLMARVRRLEGAWTDQFGEIA